MKKVDGFLYELYTPSQDTKITGSWHQVTIKEVINENPFIFKDTNGRFFLCDRYSLVDVKPKSKRKLCKFCGGKQEQCADGCIELKQNRRDEIHGVHW